MRRHLRVPSARNIIIREQELHMSAWIIAVSVAVALTANGFAGAHSTDATGLSPSLSPIVLVDATGKAVAKALNETTVLVTIGRGVVAPAAIRSIHGPDGHEASGLAIWQAGGGVLFTSPDCTTGAHVYGSSRAGVGLQHKYRHEPGFVSTWARLDKRLRCRCNRFSTTPDARRSWSGKTACTPSRRRSTWMWLTRPRFHFSSR